MMIKRFAMATALFLAGSVASAHVPNIFVAGQPAKAQEINENFEHLLSEHSNYGVGGSTGGADGVDVGGTTLGRTLVARLMAPLRVALQPVAPSLVAKAGQPIVLRLCRRLVC